MIEKEGFKFCFDEKSCETCQGLCCIGDGFVFLNENDIEGISLYLGISKTEFVKTYTREAYGKKALIDLVIKGEKRCVFLNDSYRCEIYPKRPKQCKEFPFWENLKEKKIENLEGLCPGIVVC